MSEHQVLWRATCSLGDYFARLGGAARYAGMQESEIYLFVACRSLDIAGQSDYVSRFVSPEFLSAADHVIAAVNQELEQLQQKPANIQRIVLDYALHYDAKLGDERSHRWSSFCNEVRENAV